MNKNPKPFKAYKCVLPFAYFGFLITKQAYLSELSWEAWNCNCKCNETMKKARDHFRNLFWGHPTAANIQLLQIRTIIMHPNRKGLRKFTTEQSKKLLILNINRYCKVLCVYVRLRSGSHKFWKIPSLSKIKNH